MTSQEAKNNIKETVNKIVSDFDPEKVILFGSYAWGKPNVDSDVDLCVVKETEDTRQLAQQIDKSLSPRFFPLDLLVFEPEVIEERLEGKDSFVTDIINRGTLLYEK